ncbi:MAG: putative toxin-antitoxin system toxin component, PIN family [Casimicrobium sp.]
MDGAVNASANAPARLVIDTNVLVSALVFKDSRHLPLRQAWQAGRVIPLLSIKTYRELKRVLGYEMFKLSDDQIAEGIAHLGPFIEWVTIDDAQIGTLPKCSDRDDQKFLNAALCGRADALLTYDRAVLKLRKRVPFAITKPEVWSEQLYAPTDRQVVV